MDAWHGEYLPKTEFSPPAEIDFSENQFPGEQPADKKYLVFYLMDEIFAISAGRISEVVFLPAITTLPGVPEWLLGIVNLRGEIVTVADLAKLWNKKGCSPAGSKTKLIVLRGKKSNDSIAFTTDKLGEIINLYGSEIQTGTNNTPEILGQTIYKSKTLNLLDAEKLITRLKSI